MAAESWFLYDVARNKMTSVRILFHFLQTISLNWECLNADFFPQPSLDNILQARENIA